MGVSRHIDIAVAVSTVMLVALGDKPMRRFALQLRRSVRTQQPLEALTTESCRAQKTRSTLVRRQAQKC